ncbi:MAG TPA: prepilin-type N-terminal cleavage/methylation domain-containing protein [Phycisphaerales bacterium]|nr:prepilin-type N-terminal cleavage/methylation domain-containing protein [Phycisphaerales bacterium]
MTRIIRRAFTMTELLVVIAIVVLLMAIAVPAFSSLMSSSERSLAENQLKAALAGARDVAIQSETGDSVAAFFFTPGGRVSIVACVSVGRLPVQDVDQDPTAPPREVFVPVNTSEPFQMPRGWSVRGLAAEGTVFNPTAGTGITQRELWYRSHYGATPDNAAVGDTGWVFPENAMFNQGVAANMLTADWNALSTATPNLATNLVGPGRRTFVVRFKMGTGEVDLSNSATVLIFDPVLRSDFRATRAPYDYFRSDQLRINGVPSSSAVSYVRRVLADPFLTNYSTGGGIRRTTGFSRALLGVASPDTILARPVSELALYKEANLIAGIGGRGPNAVTGTYWSPDGGTHFEIDSNALPASVTSMQAVSVAVRNWIEGGRQDSDADRERRTYDARIFTLTRYLGQTEEVEP